MINFRKLRIEMLQKRTFSNSWNWFLWCYNHADIVFQVMIYNMVWIVFHEHSKDSFSLARDSGLVCNLDSVWPCGECLDELKGWTIGECQNCSFVVQGEMFLQKMWSNFFDFSVKSVLPRIQIHQAVHVRKFSRWHQLCLHERHFYRIQQLHQMARWPWLWWQKFFPCVPQSVPCYRSKISPFLDQIKIWVEQHFHLDWYRNKLVDELADQ